MNIWDLILRINVKLEEIQSIRGGGMREKKVVLEFNFGKMK